MTAPRRCAIVGGGLAGFVSFFDSAKNPAWAGPILIVALLGSLATAVAIFWRVVLAPAPVAR